MRLNKWLILGYLGCLVATIVLGVYYRSDLLFPGWDLWPCFFIYLGHLTVYGYGGWQLAKRWNAQREAEGSLDLEADSRQFKAHMKACKAAGKAFVDPEFPAKESSLITDWNEDHSEVKEQAAAWKKYHWMRAEKIPELNDDEGKLELFKGGIEPNDIQ